LAGHAEDVKAADFPHRYLIKQKNLPPENLTGGAVTWSSQRLLLRDAEDLSVSSTRHPEHVKGTIWCRNNIRDDVKAGAKQQC